MKNFWFLLLLIAVIGGCVKQNSETEMTRFSYIPSGYSKINFVNRLKETEEMNIIEYLYFNNGGGVAAGDLNNDGLTDLYFTANQTENKLYLNRGNLTFQDITRAAGVEGKGNWTTGVTMADVNGDGWLDIYVCHVGNYKGLQGKNQLFINQGDLTFQDQAKDYGLDFQGFSTQAAFFDYDLDGDLDMYLLNHSVHTSRSYGGAELRNDTDPRAGDRLYRNDLSAGKQTFTDVTAQSGIFSSQIGYGLGISFSDFNRDGYPDIYISNDFHENDYLYINNGDGTFTESLKKMIAHTSRSSMGNDVGDINNDGFPDIVVLDMLPDKENIRKQSGGEDEFELFNMKLKFGYGYQYVRNTLQLNLDGNRFSEIGRLAGTYSTDWSWAPLFCDLDNDGWQDLYITNGIYRRANDLDYIRFLTGNNRHGKTVRDPSLPDKMLYGKMPLYPNTNYIFHNNRNLTFSNVAELWGLPDRSYSNGAVYTDLDNDGDLDLVVNNINAVASLLENHSEELKNSHYLEVRFEGDSSNPFAVGAMVTVYADGIKQVRENFQTRGFLSSVPPAVHFGLGMSQNVDSLIVRWPDNTFGFYADISADTILTVNYHTLPKEQRTRNLIHQGTQPVQQVTVQGLDFRHREDPFQEMEQEPLIPHGLSSEGPPLAVADINGDGLQDVFVGGARGEAAALFTQNSDGSFARMDVSVFIRDRMTEDVDAAFFDADGDGDNDLYVVRGGNEYPAGDPLLADRLFLNNGKGGFLLAKPGSYPYNPQNGSCVRPCDFDNDGDTDLFVGSRSVPGAYGLSPPSFLYRNNGDGTFSDITKFALNVLTQAGMITDAAWCDVNGDQWPDLVLSGEWMNIRIFENKNGIFRETTQTAGMGETPGWWYSITAADLDKDGDMDLIAGNLGLNTLLKPSKTHPVRLLINDFDNNGTPDPLICKESDGKIVPVYSLDELVRQFPGLRDKFSTYADFGNLSVREIFGQSQVDHAQELVSVESKSVLFINDGNGRFRKKNLPVYVQFSPVRSVVVDDFNHDGFPDLCVVGNDYTMRPSLGRFDAAYGWILTGIGDLNWKTWMPDESGFILPGDARKIVPLKIRGDAYLLCSVNNDSLKIFKKLK